MADGRDVDLESVRRRVDAVVFNALYARKGSLMDRDRTENTERMVNAVEDLVKRAMRALRKEFEQTMADREHRIQRHAEHLARLESRLQLVERTAKIK